MTRSRSTRVQMILGAIVALGWVLVPGPAWAHASLVSSQPSSGERLASLPSTVSLTFSEDMMPLADLVVTGPDGSSIAVGDPVVSGATISQRVASGGAGQYVLAYRATSLDGHPLTGQIGFAVGEAAVPLGTASPTPAVADGREASTPGASGASSDPAEAGGGTGVAALWQRDVLVPLALFVGALALWSLSRRTARRP